MQRPPPSGEGRRTLVCGLGEANVDACGIGVLLLVLVKNEVANLLMCLAWEGRDVLPVADDGVGLIRGVENHADRDDVFEFKGH